MNLEREILKEIKSVDLKGVDIASVSVNRTNLKTALMIGDALVDVMFTADGDFKILSVSRSNRTYKSEKFFKKYLESTKEVVAQLAVVYERQREIYNKWLLAEKERQKQLEKERLEKERQKRLERERLEKERLEAEKQRLRELAEKAKAKRDRDLLRCLKLAAVLLLCWFGWSAGVTLGDLLIQHDYSIDDVNELRDVLSSIDSNAQVEQLESMQNQLQAMQDVIVLADGLHYEEIVETRENTEIEIAYLEGDIERLGVEIARINE